VPPRHPCIPRRYDLPTGSGGTPTIIAVGDIGQYITNGIGVTVAAAVQLIGHIIVALVILLVGYIVARFIRALLQRGLQAIGFDRPADRAGVGTALQRANIALDAAGVLAAIAGSVGF